MAIANAAARDKPFAEAAPQYAAHGLRVFPVGGEDGKRPLINSWPKVGRRTFERLSLKFATANVAVTALRTGWLAWRQRQVGKAP